MNCKECGHEFSLDNDINIYLNKSGIIFEVYCPTCETVLEAQISLMQKPVKKEQSNALQSYRSMGEVQQSDGETY